MSCKEVNVSLGSTFLKRNLITLGHCVKKIKELLESLANTQNLIITFKPTYLSHQKKTIPVATELDNLKRYSMTITIRLAYNNLGFLVIGSKKDVKKKGHEPK